ncbi:MAG: ketopantoate reductase family protein [bacterium]
MQPHKLAPIRKRYIIYGAGAIGSAIGAMLARGGNAVTLVGRHRHMKAIREEGLRIDGLLGEYRVENLSAVEKIEDLDLIDLPDYLLLCVKSFDTTEAAREISSSGLVGKNTFVVSLQNGLGNVEVCRDIFGRDRVLGGRVIFGAEIPSPGSVHISVWADDVLLGGDDMEPAKDLAAELTRCGIQSSATEDIQKALWGKVLYNVGLNSLSALLEVPYGTLGRTGGARVILLGLMEEAFSVAQGEGSAQFQSFEEYLDLFFGKLLPATVAHNSSMLQDIRKGRATEIESINGEVIKRGKAMGIDTPYNETVYNLVKAKVALHGSGTGND